MSTALGSTVQRRLDERAERWWDRVVPPSALVGRLDAALRLAVVVSIVAAVVQGVAHLVDVVLLDTRWIYLDAGADVGVFMWASSVATFAAGVALLWCAVIARSGRILAVMGAFVVFLSLDDAVQIHERAGGLAQRLVSSGDVGRLAWPVIYLPLVVLLALGLVAFTRRAPGRIGPITVASLVALAIAILLELSSYGLLRDGFDYGGWVYELEVALEEGLELAGWMLIAATVGACSLLIAAGSGSPSEV